MCVLGVDVLLSDVVPNNCMLRLHAQCIHGSAQIRHGRRHIYVAHTCTHNSHTPSAHSHTGAWEASPSQQQLHQHQQDPLVRHHHSQHSHQHEPPQQQQQQQQLHHHTHSGHSTSMLTDCSPSFPQHLPSQAEQQQVSFFVSCIPLRWLAHMHVCVCLCMCMCFCLVSCFEELNFR